MNGNILKIVLHFISNSSENNSLLVEYDSSINSYIMLNILFDNELVSFSMDLYMKFSSEMAALLSLVHLGLSLLSTFDIISNS